MGKISKSDQPQTKDAADATRAALAALQARQSPHFEVGTVVICANRRGTVLNRFTAHPLSETTYLTVRWEDGSVSSIAPHALNRR